MNALEQSVLPDKIIIAASESVKLFEGKKAPSEVIAFMSSTMVSRRGVSKTPLLVYEHTTKRGGQREMKVR